MLANSVGLNGLAILVYFEFIVIPSVTLARIAFVVIVILDHFDPLDYFTLAFD